MTDGERLAVLENEVTHLKGLRAEVDALRTWRAWQVGLFMGVGALAMLIANGVLPKLVG